jgi:hypothetical protein
VVEIADQMDVFGPDGSRDFKRYNDFVAVRRARLVDQGCVPFPIMPDTALVDDESTTHSKYMALMLKLL